jgi:hypothetical protein
MLWWVDARLTLATGTAEREAGLEMIAARRGNHRITLRRRQGLRCGQLCRRRTTRHPGYAVSGRVRKRVEKVFGWAKGAAGFGKTRHCGLARVGWMLTLTATAYNLVRLPKLVGAVA